MRNINEITINQIIIIQSLSATDRKIAEEIELRIKYTSPKVKLHDFAQIVDTPTKEVFFSALTEIKTAVKSGMRPMIHIDMHGSEDGLWLSEETTVLPWKELKEPIREINIASKNNLFFSLSTCYGANFIDLYECSKPCPFYGYIAPLFEIDVRKAEAVFCDFFETLMLTGNIKTAIQKIQDTEPEISSTWVFINCDEYFRKLLMVQQEVYSDQNNIEKTIQRLLPLAQRRLKNDMPIDSLREILKTTLSKDFLNPIFESWRKTFLHLENHQEQ